MSFIKSGRVEVPVIDLSPTPRVTLDDIRHRRFLMPRPCPVCGQGSFSHSKDLESHIEGSDDGVHAAYIVLNS